MRSATEPLFKKTDKEIWRRGMEYADTKRVEISNVSDDEIAGVVEGTSNYEVSIKFAPRGISQKCDCPYYLKHGSVCKHIVAVAIIWDNQRGLKVPDKETVDRLLIPERRPARKDVSGLFKRPLETVLDEIRSLPEGTALGGYIRPRSQLPKLPKGIATDVGLLDLKTLRKCFSEIRSWSRRKSFDPYFCSGEMVAAFCELLRIVKERFNEINAVDAAKMLLTCQEFNRTLVVELVDDSLGLHEISEAHLEAIYGEVMATSRGSDDSAEVNRMLDEFEGGRGQY